MKAVDLIEAWAGALTMNEAALLDVAIGATLLATERKSITITRQHMTDLGLYKIERTVNADGEWSISLVPR